MTGPDPATPPGTPPAGRRWRKKPVVIEARQLLDDLRNHSEVAAWVEAGGGVALMPFAEPCLYIETMEGRMRADIGDWVVKGVKNEFYPCKPDVFAATYEPASGPDPIEAESGAHAGERGHLRGELAEVAADRDRLAAENERLRTAHDQMAGHLNAVARIITRYEDEELNAITAFAEVVATFEEAPDGL